MHDVEQEMQLWEASTTMVTMLHGEIWNTLEIRYLYGYIRMRKILELDIL